MLMNLIVLYAVVKLERETVLGLHLEDAVSYPMQPYSLEMYKSKEEKLALLDEAIRQHDGNAITMVQNDFCNIVISCS